MVNLRDYCRLLVTVAAVAALAGCAAGTGPQPSVQGGTVAGADPYYVVDVNNALVNVPSALLVLERRTSNTHEQRIVLPNPTTLRGDNEIRIRAHGSRQTTLKRFSFEGVKRDFGGWPHPFGDLTAGGLVSSSDALGGFAYAQRRYGANTTCVLVLRRVGAEARTMASGANALDVVMRHCTLGTLEDALAPMGGSTLGYEATSTGQIYSLSPHAAPGG